MEKSRTVKILVIVATCAIPIFLALVAFAVATVMRIDREDPPGSPLQWAVITGVVAVVILLLVLLGVWLRRRSKAGKLEKTLGQGPAGQIDTKGEIEALRKRWKESVATLKSTGMGVKGGIDSFPWFVIIGAPASGKSTLLRQSEIDFPVGDAAIKGLQGTRNCDWWFSNIGVFLDTAGRYMSDDSAQEWAAFLDLVRRLRSDAPINGVLVAVPAPDLLTKPADELEADARRIRARLDELIDGLGINFPVWIVLTKVDLLPGFVEFFGKADARMRRQTMGWTTEQAEGMQFERGQFDARYVTMMDRLREIRPQMVGKSTLRDRSAAYGFPEEMGAVQRPLADFLQRIFAQNAYQETPFCRGVYVTSATQQGTPLQRAAEQVRRILGVEAVESDARRGGITHSYFLRDLVNDRVVTDRGLVWTTETERARGKLVRLGKNLVGMSFGVFGFLAVLGFGMRAMRELEEVKLPRDTASPVAACDGLYVSAAGMANKSNLSNLGLSQQRSLKDDLLLKQRQIYRQVVLEGLLTRVETRFRDAAVDGDFKVVEEEWQRVELIRAALERASAPRTPLPPEDDEEVGDAEPGTEDEATPGADESDDAYADDEYDDAEFADEEATDDEPADDASADEAAAASDAALGLEDIEGDPAAGAPKGFFTRAEISAFRSLEEEFLADGLITKPKKRRKKGQKRVRRDLPDRLLDTLWRNGTVSAKFDAPARLAALRTVLVEKSQLWMSQTAEGIRAYESQRASQQDRIEDQRNGFEEQCRNALRLMGEQPDMEQSQLLSDVLAPLIERAESAPPPDTGTPGSEGTDTARAESPSRASGGYERLRDEVLTKDEFESLPEREFVGGWIAPTNQEASVEGQTEKERLSSALDIVRAALSKLTSDERGGKLVPDEWPARNALQLDEAVTRLQEHLRERDKAWRDQVVPALVVLGGAEDRATYEAADDRWGRAVELLDAGLRRNALLGHFLKRTEPGGYPKLAGALVTARQQKSQRPGAQRDLFDRQRLGADLVALAAPLRAVVRSDVLPQVARSLRSEALVAVKDQFRVLVGVAQAHWDRRCAGLPVYSGTGAFEHVNDWTRERGPVDSLQREVERAMKEAWDLPEALTGLPDADECWTLTTDLRQRYQFFWTDLPGVIASLRKLVVYAKPERIDLARDSSTVSKLDGDLGRGAAPATWSIDGKFAAVGSDVVPDDVRRGLARAVSDAEGRILARLHAAYSSDWRRERSEIESELSRDATVAESRYAKFRETLGWVFGRDLQDDRGPGLRVGADFARADSRLRNWFSLSRQLSSGVRVVLDPQNVPTIEGGGLLKRPYLRLVYTDGRSETKSQPWDPNTVKSGRFEFTWYLVPDSTLELQMVDRAGSSERIVSWSGAYCVLEALAVGGGGSEIADLRSLPTKVEWKGDGQYSQAKVNVTYPDRPLMERVRLLGTGDGAVGTAAECLEPLERD